MEWMGWPQLDLIVLQFLEQLKILPTIKGYQNNFAEEILLMPLQTHFQEKKIQKNLWLFVVSVGISFFKKIVIFLWNLSFFLASRTPFSVRFLSDHWEYATDAMHEAVKPGKGIRLAYSLENCGAWTYIYIFEIMFRQLIHGNNQLGWIKWKRTY